MTGAIGGIEEQYVRWSDFLLRIEPGGEDIAARVDQYREKWGLPLGFWAGSSFERVNFEFPAFVWDRPDSFHIGDFSAYIDENVACGVMLTMFVKELPHVDEKEVYLADEVHEPRTFLSGAFSWPGSTRMRAIDR